MFPGLRPPTRSNATPRPRSPLPSTPPSSRTPPRLTRLNVPTPFLSLTRRVNQKPTSSSCLHPPPHPAPAALAHQQQSTNHQEPGRGEPSHPPVPRLNPPPCNTRPQPYRGQFITPPLRARRPFLLPRGKRKKNHPPALIALCNECTMQALHSATSTPPATPTTKSRAGESPAPPYRG